MTDSTHDKLEMDALHQLPIAELELQPDSVAFLQENYGPGCTLTVGDLVDGMKFLHHMSEFAKPGIRDLFFGEIKDKLIEHGYWSYVEDDET